jgi:uncharacterized membrane protein
MSYQERRTIASLISTIVFAVVFFNYALQRYPVASPYSIDIFRFWGTTILILTPVSIFISIVVHIVFSIIVTVATKEHVHSFSDERDKLIGLKATRNTFYVFTFGFVLAMGSLVIDQPPTVMFIILICSGILAGMVGYGSRLYFYRRGF